MKKLIVTALLIAGMSSASLAQTSSIVHVRGKIASLDGAVLTVAAPLGPATTVVTLAPNVRVNSIIKATLADITAGRFIGTAATPQPDGSLRAIGITIFPVGVSPNPGTHPFDLTPTSTMTNGSVQTMSSAKVDGDVANVLTVTYDGGEKRVVVTPDTPIVTFTPADTSALVPGARVSISAMKSADGSLTAASVNVGKDGLIPPY